MSLSQEKMLALMAFSDGELAGEEKSQVEALLAKSEEARRILAAMQGDVSGHAVDAWLTSRGMREEVRATPQSHPADRIADLVMARIDAEKPKVATLAAAREKRAARVRVFAMVSAGITAIAAGVALFLGGQSPTKDPSGSLINPEHIPGRTTSTVQEVPTTPPPPSPLASNTPPPVPSIEPAPVNNNTTAVADNEGIEVHEVESPHDVSVIYLQPSVGAAVNMTPTSVVVWLGEGSRGGEVACHGEPCRFDAATPEAPRVGSSDCGPWRAHARRHPAGARAAEAGRRRRAGGSRRVVED